jgi:hypothetical protein
VSAEAIGSQDQAVAPPREGLPEIDVSRQGSWKRAADSEQKDFPSNPPGLMESPSGSEIVKARISEVERAVALTGCATPSSTSRPDGESVDDVVGFTVRFGSKASWSQPVVGGQGASAVVVSLS